MAWLVFNRNETNLGGTNGLTDFKTILGFRLSEPGTQLALYVVTVLCLGGSYVLCRWIIASRAGRVLIAIRDSEQRVLFSGYAPANYKLFVFVVSAALAGLAGILYVPQVGIITPAQMGVLPSLGGGGSLGDALVESPPAAPVELLRLRCFRPFPVAALRKACRGVSELIVVERALSPGMGGIIGTEVRAVFAGVDDAPRVHNVAVGLGGRDVPPEMLARLVEAARAGKLPTFGIFDLQPEKLPPEDR